MEFTAVGLQQHLQYRRRAAEVPVDLKDARRVQVEEAVGGEVGDQVAQVVPGLVRVAEAGEEARRPGPAPARVATLVGQAPLDRHPRRPEQLWRRLWIEAVAGVESDQM